MYFVLGEKNYMCAVDKVSGMIMASVMKNLKAETATEILSNWISMLGLPSVLKTDGGTNYTANLFENFCNKLGIQHVVSSPYNSQSNGQSERAIQDLKLRLNDQKVSSRCHKL